MLAVLIVVIHEVTGMCGIAGIVDPNLPIPEIRRTLQKMTDALIHRGPDDEGFFVAEGVGLGMRRLSVIDLDGGRQPIASEDGRVQVVFNGEIYNYADVRADLVSHGHVFATRSDTEVIVHAYEEKGSDCLLDLRGMFAIAVWDQHARQLLLARDRLGKKPLYYAQDRGRLLFGSEIKALLCADSSLAEPDPAALVPYFRYGFVPEPYTMFRRIRKVPAAHVLLARHGEVVIAPYWRLRFGAADQVQPSLRQVEEELDALLEEAVRIRLVSDVPLGVFLSGGLDSSTVVAYAHRVGLRPLKTFTVGFDRREWDESADAQLVATHFDTEHHTVLLREHELRQQLPQTVLALVRHFDEPFGDPSALPTYVVSELARRHVTVILSGDGGDELFAGYSSYKGIQFAEHYRRLPGWLARWLLPELVQGLAACLPAGRRYGALRASKVLRDSCLPFDTLYFSKASRCTSEMLRQLFTADAAAALNQQDTDARLEELVRVLRSDFPVVSKASFADLRFGLLDDMLVKVDRMSMAHSLEVRSPLLDHRLVEYVVGLPPSMKLRGWESKAILRDSVRRYLPAATLRKRKQGFRVPLRDWLRTGLHEMVADYLEDGGHLPPDILDRSTITTLLSQHRRGVADHSEVIWLLLNYATWFETYIRRGSAQAVLSNTAEALHH